MTTTLRQHPALSYVASAEDIEGTCPDCGHDDVTPVWTGWLRYDEGDAFCLCPADTACENGEPLRYSQCCDEQMNGDGTCSWCNVPTVSLRCPCRGCCTCRWEE